MCRRLCAIVPCHHQPHVLLIVNMCYRRYVYGVCVVCQCSVFACAYRDVCDRRQCVIMQVLSSMCYRQRIVIVSASLSERVIAIAPTSVIVNGFVIASVLS
jgi:hypothetical protein